MAGRALPARDRIIDRASKLFYERGIRAVGVDAVVAEAGVAKASLYAHFASNDDLVLAYLARADEAWRGHLRAAAQAAGPDPKAQLVGMFDAFGQACQAPAYRGCAFINAAAEAERGSRIHAATIEHKQKVRDWVRELARVAGARDPDGLAQALTLLIDGALSAGAVAGGSDAWVAARSLASRLVDEACPSARA